MTIRVGTVQRQYPAMRNFLGSPVPGVQFVRAGNLFRYPNYLMFKAANYIDPMLGNLHMGAGGTCDLLHFFNTVSLGRKPWVSTFETVLPRWDYEYPWAIEAGLKIMARSACRRLIAISACTANFQRSVMGHYPRYAEVLDAKMTVVHPPQEVLIEDKSPVWANVTPIRFAMVGALFFVKGGREVLRVFDRLLEEGLPLQLTIVSTLLYGDDESRSTPEDQREARRIIAKWPQHIVHHARLENTAVLDLFRASHVALLPSIADTYGYAVIEAQAAACPVITTDVRAMPEINDENRGWVISIPKDHRGTGEIHTHEQRMNLSRIIDAGLERIVREIAADASLIAKKGANALAMIKAQHDPGDHGRKLRAIYEEALSK